MLDAGTYQAANRPLNESERVDNLGILCATIPLRQRGLMTQTLSGYFDASKAISDSPAIRKALTEATKKAANKRLRRYLKKTRRTCTEFVHEERGSQRWLACRDLSPELADRLRKSPDAFFENQPLLKDGNTCTVVRLVHAGKAFVLKRYNAKRLGYRLRHAYSTPRALRSWSHGHALRAFGIATPRPMACSRIYHGRLLKRAYLFMEEVEGVSLHELPQPERMANAYASLSEELRLLQATHGDMKASNFIVTADGTLTLIDRDSVCFHQTVPSFRRQAAKDRQRFLKNWRQRPEVLAAFQEGRA